MATGEVWEVDNWRTTHIVVLEVIRGKVPLGRLRIGTDLLLGPGDPQNGFASFTGSRALSYVKDARKPAIWLLEYPKRVKGNLRRVPCAADLASVEPLELRPFYELLLKKRDRDRLIGSFLASHGGILALRALSDINGGHLASFAWFGRDRGAWEPPHEASFFGHMLLVDQWPAVQSKLSAKDPEVRASAAAVLAELIGPRAVPFLRRLITDPGAGPRLAAVTILAFFRDAISYGKFAHAIPRVHTTDYSLGSDYGCVLATLERLGSSGVVEAIAQFLEADTPDEWEPLAPSAQRSLKAITGYDFPYDKDASIGAWQEVKAFPRQDWAQGLRKLLGDHTANWDAAISWDRSGYQVRLTNLSNHSVRLAEPVSLRYEQGAGSGFACWNDGNTAVRFVTVKAGATQQFTLRQNGSLQDPKNAALSIQFEKADPNERSVSWVGRINCHVTK